ncbi:MAG: D-alanine--D-alanine ligase, partial [Rhodospirillales bacterium]|nr:D-alanine--D-alanine ligase [Rhodospirillales bacterium]
MSKHVAVLMGGWSSEREVSLISGAAVSNSLKTSGYRVTTIDVQRDL